MSFNSDLFQNVWVWCGISLYLVSMLTCWLLYWCNRPARFSLVTDAFCLFFLGLWGPMMLVYMFFQAPPEAQPAYELIAHASIVFHALMVLSVGLLAVIVGFILAETTWGVRHGPSIYSTSSAPFMCFLVGFGYCVAFAALVLALPDGRFFLSSAGALLRPTSYEDYNFLRRYAMLDSFLFSEVLARARFSANAFMYTLVCVGLIRLRRLPVAIIIIGPLTILLICSISKAPYVYYVLYPLLAYTLLRAPRLHLDGFIIRRLCIAAALGTLLMTGLYLVQYGRSDDSQFNLNSALALAFYRLFGANADALRLYVVAYPGRFDFGLGDGLSFVAALRGHPARDFAGEIVAMAGADLVGNTTYPTIFFGSAYAEFAFPGVFLYGLIIGAYLSVVQRLVAILQVLEVRIACTATLILNLSFLLTLPAPASLLSYGVGSIPLIALVLDRLIRVVVGGRGSVQPPSRHIAYGRSKCDQIPA